MIDGENTKQAASHNRKVIHATCRKHGGGAGFTNVVVTKRDGTIELDPHADGSCVLTLAEDEAVAVRDALAVCGEVLPLSELASSHCEGECDREVTYCQDCLHDAVRRNRSGLESARDAAADRLLDTRRGRPVSGPGSEGSTGNGAVEQPDCPVEHPLPAGAVHLLPADQAVQGYPMSSQITLCGELVNPSELPPSMCTPDRDEHRYCPACVREALRWNAEPSGVASLARNGHER